MYRYFKNIFDSSDFFILRNWFYSNKKGYKFKPGNVIYMGRNNYCIYLHRALKNAEPALLAGWCLTNANQSFLSDSHCWANPSHFFHTQTISHPHVLFVSQRIWIWIWISNSSVNVNDVHRSAKGELYVVCCMSYVVWCTYIARA